MRTPTLLFSLVLAGAVLALPGALSALSGSGNVTDVVELSPTVTTVGSLVSTASSASGPPVASSAMFTVTNGGSNVDTFVRYAWSTTPYYGASTGSTSIVIRSATSYISDLLWFKQETVDSASTATTSLTYTPLLIKNAASIATVSWTSSGNACTGWTGTPVGGYSAAAAGTFTVKYHLSASPVNDGSVTSESFHYCADTTSARVYLGESAAFGAATLLEVYSTNSADAILKNYQYQLLPASTTAGNRYCLTGFTGSGTAATPDLAQCEKLPYELNGATTAKLGVLYDPPTYFPSVNQGGTITYTLSGVQWNPYASSTTNSA